MWCGPEGGDGVWASLYGSLDEVGEGMLALKPGGEHHAVWIPLSRVVALAGAPRWDQNHPYRDAPLWKPYEPVRALGAPSAGVVERRMRALPDVDEEG
jgi:hypothetical protein